MSGRRRWVAFLRAINVGGHRVTSDQLIEIFEATGHAEVSTFLASGNVLFSAERPEPEPVESALFDTFGYEVPVILRSQAQVVAIAEAQPFSSVELAPTSANTQIMLRRSVDVQPSIDQLDVPDEDLLRYFEGDVFWLPRAGISDSKLNIKGLEGTLGEFTIRTVRTLVRLSARL